MANIPENVEQFLEKAAQAYGRFQADEWHQGMWGECERLSSPIEQLFMVAVHLVAEVNLRKILVVDEFKDGVDDLFLIPQWRVGKYRVDFALRNGSANRAVCVELDGHEFHDRNERQRRYEKGRDRFLTVAGHSVLHFTGAEVVKDPCAVALESFNLATGLEEVALHPFESM